MIEIKQRYTNAILFIINTPSLRGANLCGANLRGANLCDADLCGADLRGANLRGANLCDADLCDADLCGADLCGADLCGANLCDANLCDASLRGANLCDASLRGANLNGEKLKSNPIFIYGLKWHIVVTNKYLTIGCQRHLITDWQAFSDMTISNMHINALSFWKTYKAMLMQLCAIQMMKTEETSDDQTL